MSSANHQSSSSEAPETSGPRQSGSPELPVEHSGHSPGDLHWIDAIARVDALQIGRALIETCCAENAIAQLATLSGRTWVLQSVEAAHASQVLVAIDGAAATLAFGKLREAPPPAQRGVWSAGFDGVARPFQIAGTSLTTYVEGRTPRGPCSLMDSRVGQLLVDGIAAMHGIVSAGRAAPVAIGDEAFALQQVLLALLALSASEAEALSTLVQFDQMPGSRVHLRALGEHTEHALIFLADRALVLRAFRATNASRAHLFDKLSLDTELRTIDAELRKAIDAKLDTSAEAKTLRKLLERVTPPANAFAQVDSWEHDWNSKWSHGDSVALHEVASRLANPRVYVGAAIQHTSEGNGNALRAMHYMLTLMYLVKYLLGIENDGVDDLLVRHTALAAELTPPRVPRAADVG